MKPIPRKARPTGKPAPAGKTPTPAAKTPMANAKMPTSTAKTSTVTAKTPTAPAKTPTATAKTPTASAKAPIASAKTPTSAKAPIASAKTPTASAKAPIASAKTPTASTKTPTASAKAPTASAKTVAGTRTAPAGKTLSVQKTAAGSRTAPAGKTLSVQKTAAGSRTAPAGKTLSVQKTAAQSGITRSRTASANGLRDLFEVGLKDIYYAEKVLAKSLPKMVKNATSAELVNELNNHLAVTKEQVSRLEQIFKSTGIKAQAIKCDAMDGLLKETDNIMELAAKGTVRDAGIIASDQKVDHYEIASFGTLHAYAKTLGEHEAASLLSLTLDEAKKVDAALTRLAMTGINSRAWKADALTTIKGK